MITGKTPAGFEYQMHDDVMDDFEILELVGAVDKSLTALPELIDALFGKEQATAYREFMRNPDTKRISTMALAEDIDSMFRDLNSEPETKNS